MRIFNRTNEDIVIDGWIIPPEKMKIIKSAYEYCIIVPPYGVIEIYTSFGSAEEDIYDVVKKGDGNGSNWIHREQ